MKRIFFLGPRETFTEQAAKSIVGRIDSVTELIPKRSLEEVIEGVDDKTSGVVPYYNLYEGLIQETLDLIMENRLRIAAAQRVEVRFALGGFPRKDGAPEDEIVYSHPKALAQCSNYLSDNYKQALRQEVLSTAEGTQIVARKKQGLAVARREALETAGLPILADDIGNRQYGRSNYTEFLYVAKTVPQNLSMSDEKRTMVAILPTVDRVGLLADILGQISFCGINLQKIHSRPALIEPIDGKPLEHDPQMFYLEMEGSAEDPAFRLCMETLNLRLARTGEISSKPVRVLGDYPLFR